MLASSMSRTASAGAIDLPVSRILVSRAVRLLHRVLRVLTSFDGPRILQVAFNVIYPAAPARGGIDRFAPTHSNTRPAAVLLYAAGRNLNSFHCAK